MDLQCPYSGVQYKTAGFSAFTLKRNLPHPIFSLTPRELLVRCRDWKSLRLQPVEEKLLFLAFLNQTKSVDFHTVALPTKATVARHFTPVIKLVGAGLEEEWKFPHYIISKEAGTDTLPNLGSWLDKCFEIKNNYLSSGSNKIYSRSLERNLRIAKLLKKPFQKLETYSPKLWEWLERAVTFPPNKAEEWKNLFLLPLPGNEQTLSVHLPSLLSLEEFLLIELYATEYGSLEADTCLKYIKEKRVQITRYTLGQYGENGDHFKILPADLWMELDSLDQIEEKSAEQKARTESNLPPEILVANRLSKNAPASEPKKEDFPSIKDWMKAKVSWTLAQNIQKGRAGQL